MIVVPDDRLAPLKHEWMIQVLFVIFSQSSGLKFKSPRRIEVAYCDDITILGQEVKETYCLHDGLCVYDGEGRFIKCHCNSRFTGKFCESPVGCYHQVKGYCRHGGSCEETQSGTHRCICSNEFTGSHCQERRYLQCVHGIHKNTAKDSFNRTCRNLGICMKKNKRFLCKCSDKFTGSFCESPIFKHGCEGVYGRGCEKPCGDCIRPCDPNTGVCPFTRQGSKYFRCNVGSSGERCDKEGAAGKITVVFKMSGTFDDVIANSASDTFHHAEYTLNNEIYHALRLPRMNCKILHIKPKGSGLMVKFEVRFPPEMSHETSLRETVWRTLRRNKNMFTGVFGDEYIIDKSSIGISRVHLTTFDQDHPSFLIVIICGASGGFAVAMAAAVTIIRLRNERKKIEKRRAERKADCMKTGHPYHGMCGRVEDDQETYSMEEDQDKAMYTV